MQIQIEMVSAEPGIAPHSAGTSVHDLNMQSNHLLKSQVTQCTCNEDTKKSVDLRDISVILPELKVRSVFAERIMKKFCNSLFLDLAIRVPSERIPQHSTEKLILQAFS